MTSYTGAKSAVQQLTGYIDTIPVRFRKLTEADLLERPAPGKWSRQEILGHLVDSALNNLKRFTEIQFLPQPYQVVRYSQDDLVQVNRYQHLPLEHLLDLWQSLNRQIVLVTDQLEPALLKYVVITPGADVRNLEWLINDYVVHLEHHLNQVFIQR